MAKGRRTRTVSLATRSLTSTGGQGRGSVNPVTLKILRTRRRASLLDVCDGGRGRGCTVYRGFWKENLKSII